MLNNIRQIKDYKSPIQEILAASSLAYLLSPFRSKRLLIKIIWSLFLIIFLFLSIYYVILNILDYLQYNTTTSIYTINEQEIDFPTVSFCLKRDYYASENIFEIEIVALWFNNQNLLNEWSNHLESYQDLYYGQCYRYNSGLNMSNQSIPFKKLKASGRDDGLWLEFASKSSENTSKPIVLYIHNQTQMPATIYNKGRFISKGLNTYLIMKRIYDQKLESPYNDCFNNVSQYPFNKTIINYLSSKNREYTQKECFYLCRNLKSNEFNYCNFTYLESLDTAKAVGSAWFCVGLCLATQRHKDTKMGHNCDTCATQMGHNCDTTATQLRHKCDTTATQVRHKCDTSDKFNKLI